MAYSDIFRRDKLQEAFKNAGGSKVYKATLQQTGTSAPTATVLANTLGGVPTLAYAGVGNYTLTLTGAFPDATKIVMYAQNEGSTNSAVFLSRTDANTIDISSYDVIADVAGNDLIWNTAIIIEIYE